MTVLFGEDFDDKGLPTYYFEIIEINVQSPICYNKKDIVFYLVDLFREKRITSKQISFISKKVAHRFQNIFLGHKDVDEFQRCVSYRAHCGGICFMECGSKSERQHAHFVDAKNICVGYPIYSKLDGLLFILENYRYFSTSDFFENKFRILESSLPVIQLEFCN